VDNNENILTPSSMPSIDLGDKPSTYGPNSDESDQMFIIPKSSYPNRFNVRYSQCKPSYNLNKKSLMKKFKKTDFEERGISFDEF